MSDALTNINPRRIMHMAALGAMVVLGAMGLLTWQALRLERREQAAQAQAQFQESLRKALWRIDSAMTPIIAREAARPYFEYQSFYPTKPTDSPRPGNDESSADAASEVLVPSPLLSNADAIVNIHFQVDAAGVFTSPQVPAGKMRDLAEAGYITPYAISSTESRLVELQNLTKGVTGNERGGTPGTPAVEPKFKDQSLAAVTQQQHANVAGDAPEFGTPSGGQAKPSSAEATKPPAPPTQREAIGDADNEYAARKEALNKATTQYNQQAEEVARGQQRSVGAKDKAYRNAKEDDTRAIAQASEKDVEQQQKATQASDAEVESKSESNDSALRGTPTHRANDRSLQEGTGTGPGTTTQAVQPRAPGETSPPPLSASTIGEDASAWPAGELIVQGQFTPRWLSTGVGDSEPELIFVRSVRVGERSLEQGFWLNWPSLREMLLEPVKPLFAQCTIRPIPASDSPPSASSLGRMLATIPAELVVDDPAPVSGARWTPLRGVLVVVWVLVLGSVVAMFGIVRASIELAERRGRFVSAVTHELRTPLTTFCLYSQMLSDGMVPSEDAKRHYARTLHHESIRLTRIVESVLDFARLGRGSKAAFETITLRDLRSKVEPGLLAACDRAEMRLDVTLTCDADQPVRTDPAILERVLGNLVDNACKYAKQDANTEQNRVVLTWSIENGRLRAAVRDFGPGVPFEEQTRVFDAFVRGREHSHGSTPGLGLGLALSKGLAEQLGGELRITQHAPGVEFTIDVSAA